MDVKKKLNAFLMALVMQLCIVVLVFFGGLLDPLLGLWVAAAYFFVIGTYLMYSYLLKGEGKSNA
ncbi:MAG: hypothetical protein WC785_10955 [Tatlockia sp.]|jgi:hypothetical protein